MELKELHDKLPVVDMINIRCNSLAISCKFLEKMHTRLCVWGSNDFVFGFVSLCLCLNCHALTPQADCSHCFHVIFMSQSLKISAYYYCFILLFWKVSILVYLTTAVLCVIREYLYSAPVICFSLCFSLSESSVFIFVNLIQLLFYLQQCCQWSDKLYVEVNVSCLLSN